MTELLDFDEFLRIDENRNNFIPKGPEWKDGGIVLIKGKPLKDGVPRLYAAKIRRIWENSRGGYMANIYPQIYIILRDKPGQYTAHKIHTDQEILARAVGIESLNLVLNAKSGKTPLWRDSVNEMQFPKFLREFAPVIDTWTEFKLF